MKQILLIIIFLSVQNLFSQTNDPKIRELVNSMDSLKTELTKMKQDETSLFNLKKSIINDKLDYQKLEYKVKEAHRNWFTKYFDLGLLIGGFLSMFAYGVYNKKTIKNKIAEQIAKLTKREISFVSKNIDELKKHTNLKKDANILILNEAGTKFPEGFEKVISLFEIDPHTDKIEINGLHNALAPENIALMKKADMVIIENQVEDGKHWKLNMGREIDNRSKIEKAIADDKNKEACQNNLYLIDLANKICDATSIIYYGQQGKGNFPSAFVKPDLQYLISFANAPSQLYGNMLNMLKFRSELNIKV